MKEMVDAEKKAALVVDDAPAHIRIVTEILHNTCKVKIASSNAKALEATGSAPADVLLMDVVVSEMDGHEVCTSLKSNPSTRDVLASHTETTDETHCFEVRAVDYIHKRFSPTVGAVLVQAYAALREAHEQLERRLATIHAALDTAPKIKLSILLSEVPRIAGLDIAGRFPGE